MIETRLVIRSRFNPMTSQTKDSVVELTPSFDIASIEPSPAGALDDDRNPVSHLLIVLHGIRGDARFCDEYDTIKGVIETDIRVTPISYDRLGTVPFLLASRDDEIVRFVAARMDAIIKSNPGRLVSIFCHSNATKVISAIIGTLSTPVQYVFLCGSICKTSDVDKFDCVKRAAVNECGILDALPILAAAARPDRFGPTGTIGFSNWPIKDRFFKYGHSGALSKHHVDAWILPVLIEGRIRKPALGPLAWCKHAPGYLRTGVFLLLLILIGTLIARALA